MSDGVYDNFDPQHLGLTPREVDSLFEYDDWQTAPANIAESLKTQFIVHRLEKMLNDFADEEFKVRVFSDLKFNLLPETHFDLQTHELLALDIEKFVNMLTKHCYDFTKSSRDFMETNPGKKQPADYKLFPGKLDHTTAIAIKVIILVLHYLYTLINTLFGTKSFIFGHEFLIVTNTLNLGSNLNHYHNAFGK